jgi:hypothetical protein
MKKKKIKSYGSLTLPAGSNVGAMRVAEGEKLGLKKLGGKAGY